MRLLLALTLSLAASAHAQIAPPKVALAPPKVAPTPPTLSATASVVLDLESGRVLDAKNPHLRLFPASTTKIMTCLVALERGDLDQVIRAGKNAADTGETGIYLMEGEKRTLRELIQAAMIHSANDACVAISEGVGGTQAQFLTWMNQKARDLGCRDTNFSNPHGLHSPNHFSSAYDLALIARAASKVAFINQVVRQKSVIIGGNPKIGPSRLLRSRNKLLLGWPQCDGFKTGYTRQAGNCLVASASQIDPQARRPWRLLAVALKSAPGRSFGDCQLLLQRAFAGYAPQLTARGGEIVAQKAVSGGAFALRGVLARDVRLVLNPFERAHLERRVKVLPLVAPIRRGAIVGNVEYWAARDAASVAKPRRIAQRALLSRGDVPQTILAQTIPQVGNRVGAVSFAARLLLLGLICAGAAFALLFKRQSHARRRSHPAFQNVRFEPRSGANNATKRSRN